jgi:D-alanyl-D-alanine carboxypeptidase
MAILARAIIREFPEHDFYWNIPAIRFGKKVMRNYNSLIGRYPGADGMKTGFICASGFNVVASATRDGKRLIAVVLGAPSSSVRAYKAAQMLERGFGAGILSWLAPSLGHVDSLPAIDAAPPNLREDMCGKNRKRPAAEDSEDEESAQANGTVNSSSQFAVFLSQLRAPNSKPSELLGPPAAANPIVVHVGPPKQAPAKQLATAPRQGSSRPASRADVAAVGAGPVTAFAPSTLAASEPETTTRAAAVVPTPRPRPKVNAKPANR